MWIFIEVGSFRRYNNPINFLFLNNLICLWFRFFDGRLILIFFVDSYTLSLILYFNGFFLCLLAVVACVSCDFAISVWMKFYTSSMQLAINFAMALAILLQVESADKLMRLKFIFGLYLFVTKNSEILIIAEILALAANFSIGSNCT